jgi:hypothetical protein
MSGATADASTDAPAIWRKRMPFFSGGGAGVRLKMVVDAMVGAYGLTFITLGVSSLLVYVLQQLRLI